MVVRAANAMMLALTERVLRKLEVDTATLAPVADEQLAGLEDV